MLKRKCVVFAASAIMSIGALGVTALPANATAAPEQHTSAAAAGDISALHVIEFESSGVVNVANAAHSIKVNAAYYKDGEALTHGLDDVTVDAQGAFSFSVPIGLDPGSYEVSYTLIDGDRAADTKSLTCRAIDRDSATELVHVTVENTPAVTCAFSIE